MNSTYKWWWDENKTTFLFSLLQPITAVSPPTTTDGDLARVLPGQCWVAHSRCHLIKLQPCSLLSCWQTKVLKRTPSVIASNLGHNVLFHVNVSQRKGSRCSRLASTFTLSNTVQQTSARIFFLIWFLYSEEVKRLFNCNSGKHFLMILGTFAWVPLIWLSVVFYYYGRFWFNSGGIKHFINCGKLSSCKIKKM